MEGDPMDEIRRRRLATEKLMSVRNAHCDMMLHKNHMTIDKQETKSVRLLQHSASQVHYEFKVMQVNLQKNEVQKRRLQDPNGDFTFEIANISKNERLLKGGANDVFYMQKNNPTQTRSMKNPNIISPALAQARKILRQKVTERELETYRHKQDNRKIRPHTTGNRDIKFSFDKPNKDHNSPKKFNSIKPSLENNKIPKSDNVPTKCSESILSTKSNISPTPKTPQNITPHKMVRIQSDIPEEGSTSNCNDIQNEYTTTVSKEGKLETTNGDETANTHKNFKHINNNDSQFLTNKEQSTLAQRSSRNPINCSSVNLQSSVKSDIGLYNRMLLKKEGKLQVDKGSDAILKLREMGIIPMTREKSCPNLSNSRPSPQGGSHRSNPMISRSHTSLSTGKHSHSPNHASMPSTPRRPRTQERIHNEHVSIQQKLHKFYHTLEEDKQRWLREQEQRKVSEEVVPPDGASGLELLLQQTSKQNHVDQLLLGLPPINKNLPTEEYQRRRSEQLRKKWREVGQQVMDNLDAGVYDNPPEEEIPTTGHVYSSFTPLNSHSNNSNAAAANSKSQNGTMFAPDGTMIQRFTGFGNSGNKRGGGPPMHSSNRSKRKTATFKLRKLVEDIMANKTRYELQEYADTRKKMNTNEDT